MLKFKTLLIALLFALVSCQRASQPEQEIAHLPPMGWNSWNVFRSGINEDLIKEIAEAMIKTGLTDAGYVYVNIDDGWNLGQVQKVNTNKFPSGMKSMADFMHERGLKLGIYTRWNSIGHEERDAQTFAEWGIDFIKNNAWKTESTGPYWKKMHDAIRATGRPIVHSIHFYTRPLDGRRGRDSRPYWKVIRTTGSPNVHSIHLNNEATNLPNITEICDMWRITGDIQDYYNYESVSEDKKDWAYSTLDIIDQMAEVSHLIEPGCWADVDMFEIGNGNQTIDEYKTQFTMWSLLPAPLIMGHDVRNMSKEILDILTNDEVIAVNQDPAVIPARRIFKTDAIELWARRLAGGSFSVVLLNKTESSREIEFSWRQIGLEHDEAFELRDLWEHKDLGVHSGSFSVEVASHGCAMLKLSPEQ